MELFSAIAEGITYLVKGAISIKDWFQQKIKLADDVEAAVKDNIPNVVTLLDAAQTVATTAIGDAAADLSALQVFVDAVEQAWTGGSIPTGVVDVVTNPAVAAALEAFCSQIANKTTATTFFATVGNMVKAAEACGAGAEASLKQIEADA